MNEKVTFDGINKIIICESGVTSLDFAEDVYSAWKRWSLLSDNTKYLQAISVIGGDPITDIINLGTTFFIENGWKIRPYEGNHTLTVYGNFYTRDASPAFINTVSNYNVSIQTIKSNLVDTVVMGSGVTAQDKEDIKNLIFQNIVESNLTAEDMLKIMFAVLANKSSGGGTNTITFRDKNDSKDRIKATVDDKGNRLSVIINSD